MSTQPQQTDDSSIEAADDDPITVTADDVAVDVRHADSVDTTLIEIAVEIANAVSDGFSAINEKPASVKIKDHPCEVVDQMNIKIKQDVGSYNIAERVLEGYPYELDGMMSHATGTISYGLIEEGDE